MQYTLRNIPSRLDGQIRERARDEGKSLNQVVLEALLRAFGLKGHAVKHRDLGDMSDTWPDDPELDEALQNQRQIDPELWK